MGADLIGFLVKGPRTLNTDHDTLAQAEAVVTASLPVLHACNERLQDNLDLSGDTFGGIDLTNIPHLDSATLEAHLPIELPEKAPAGIVAEFIKFWHVQDARDIASRVDPDDPNRILMFAGEMTWGDPPDGYAYTQLALSLLLGLWDVFGIR